jgi:hypothetical protein
VYTSYLRYETLLTFIGYEYVFLGCVMFVRHGCTWSLSSA